MTALAATVTGEIIAAFSDPKDEAETQLRFLLLRAIDDGPWPGGKALKHTAAAAALVAFVEGLK